LIGLDRAALDEINFELAINRIQVDVRTDFIIAPHFNYIFVKAGDELCSRAFELLKSGRYEPALPITLCIPKPRGFTRPGSILKPIDRLIYQAIADNISPIIEEGLDRKRTFSHVLIKDKENSAMFKPYHESWGNYKNKFIELCKHGDFILKADVSNYFERIPQHHLINLLHASVCNTIIVNLLEKVLLAFRERNSFGIIQGNFPSDLLGNFYLSDIDAFCELNDIDSARYVDDLYLSFNKEIEAYKGLIALIERLRKNGLNLNESKSGVKIAKSLTREESELDDIFNEAREEIENEMFENAIQEKIDSQNIPWNIYGFSTDWEIDETEIELDEEEIHLATVEKLYESIEEFPNQADKIEKFSLPILSMIDSTIAIDRSIQGIIERPYLARTYTAYLSNFTPKDSNVVSKLEKLLDEEKLVSDYQIIYIFASLLKSKSQKRKTVNTAIKILENHKYKKETRAITAQFAAKYGNPQQKKFVKLAYESEPSPYVRSAILYASRHFSRPEKKACLIAWGGHSLENSLISYALKK